ncbi:MAG: pentapeptide repeat-containing protein [Candidatus Contendobacter sp.]|nr:pentapeptide repeat-containing protein [Candidatus Contendobacter sp.]MDG4559014.1 pentapeptide repeat-containing protein [Candidatus Contendobacter sp.]
MPLTRQEQRQRVAALLAAPTKAAPDAKALLDAANSASQTVAVLHVAFMAVCAYVLVIVFGTTDLDLLMGGNNVKLPVIDVAVPIVGFYAFAPYLVVLMHLNLLLQLQLLSRKLFAFDAATPAEESVGGLRDRLHIFPYTYYLVGRPGVVVGGLLGLVVSVSLIVLPLATLLALQLKFLAYQAEGITWAQRVAVFLDVGLLVALWPVILHPRDDWQAWWRETLAAYLPKKRAWLAVIVLVASVALILFAATPDIFAVGLVLGSIAPLLLILLVGHFSDERTRRACILFAMLLGLLAALWALVWGSKNSLLSIKPAIWVALFLGGLMLSFFWHPKAPRGSLALLSALVLTPLLALGLMVDGEGWEAAMAEAQRPLLDWQMPGRQRKTLAQQFESDSCRSIGQTALSCVVLAEQRRLDLNERALFAKPPSPELLAALRAGKGLENKDKLERISLAGRSLRRAQMESALLVGADLRSAQLQGADLSQARLQGADLRWARLQGADLGGVRLQGAVLVGAKLQGADLVIAELQGAVLMGAELQGADLMGAELQGADLVGAELQGADLMGARLQGADLMGARLQGAIFLDSTIYENGDPAQSNLLDVRRASITPLSEKESSEIPDMQVTLQPFIGQIMKQPLKSAATPSTKTPTFASCLTDGKSQPKCQQVYDVTNPDQRREFMMRLHEALATLACKDIHIASGIHTQTSKAPFYMDSTRAGLASVLLARMKAKETCPGLAGLSAEDKAKLEQLAKDEAERERAAKATGAGQR